MNFLLVNTCGDEAVIALGSELGVVTEERMPGRTASEGLLGAIRRVLDGLAVSELAGVGVVTGPGSFTGVRVGLSAAKGLCLAAGIGMVGMSRLGLLGQGAVLDAGRGEFFFGDRAGERLVREEELPAGPLVTCEARVCDRLGERVQLVPEPGGEAMLREMMARLAAGSWSDVAGTDASYLRRTDAELARERAG